MSREGEISQRAESLATGLLGPLLEGGAIELQRPIGRQLGLAIGVNRDAADHDLAEPLAEARSREARAIAGVSVAPPLSRWDWSLLAGLNDLLQVTNHHLSSFASRGRHQALLEALESLCRQIPPCLNLEAALGRHVTFSRASMIQRMDSQVSWWTGSAEFRGEPPPERLFTWRELRRVTVARSAVPLAEMATGVAVDEKAYQEALASWLRCSPLTDLATAWRPVPAFRWSEHSLSLVATSAGRTLAMRAIRHHDSHHGPRAGDTMQAFKKAQEALPPGPERQLAASFASWLGAARSHWAATQLPQTSSEFSGPGG